MRVALESDIPRLEMLYGQALNHANTVGHIDWPSPFTSDAIQALLNNQALFCFEKQQRIDAAVRITTLGDARIWQEDERRATYLAKIATSDFVRGTSYFGAVMLPQIKDFIASKNDALRLDCLADNPKLKHLYMRLGFTSCGDITFYSEKQKSELTVSRFELMI